MKDFKFFQKKVKGTLDLYEGETRATASFDADTPEGHMFRRRLYHTDRDYYDRLHNVTNNNEMERYYYDRQLGRFETAQSRQRIEDNERAERIIRRLNGGETSLPFFASETRATKLNPKWWMKIKMFFQKIKYNSVIETNSDALGIFVIATTVTIIFGLMIAKVLNIW
jgi:hypothetical protein